MLGRIKRVLFGKPRDINDPEVYHRISLIAFLAWIGLGADGLSSSSYGPDEAFRALGSHAHLAILLAVMTAATIIVISIAYSNLIEHFPGGGGGYLVASKLLGRRVGMISGCALLVDYFLTIAVSIAAGCDALWSFLPPAWMPYKLFAEIVVLLFLILLNLRGVKESVTFLAPIFIVFIATHLLLILYAVGSRFTALPSIATNAAQDLQSSVQTIGFSAVLLILLRAYSMGGGTYTGIEAVSNGLAILREPRVQTGKKTMFLMAASLAFTAGGILLGYLLVSAVPVAGKTMNAVLLENLFSEWTWNGLGIGRAIVIITLMSEAALLFVAAQTGFLGGPRVLANMAVDSWVPRRFAQLSDRLVNQHGIYWMGTAAMAALLYTHGNITMLVVMYSINVFATFVLTETGMSLHFIKERGKNKDWKRLLALHGTGLVMCLCILFGTLFVKFGEGGWMTVMVTGTVVGLCFVIRGHYEKVQVSLKRLDELLTALPAPEDDRTPTEPMDKRVPTAVVLVNRYSGFGMHQIFSIQKLFPNYFRNFIFVSVGMVDSGNFKGAEAIDALELQIRGDLEKYVEWCRSHGFHSDFRMAVDTELVRKITEICRELSREFSRSIFFAGKLIFQQEKIYHDILHNETAYSIQRQLQFDGMQTIVLPIRVL